MAPTRSPTTRAVVQSSAAPHGHPVAPGCHDDLSFHVKDCPFCTCQWFHDDISRCTMWGKAQAAQRDAATGKWHRANTACCACAHVLSPSTATPTAAPLPAVPAPGTGALAGCADKVGKNDAGMLQAFHIKGCDTCTCAWLAKEDRCTDFGAYTGHTRDVATNRNMKPAEACCVCGGGAR